MMCVLQVLDSNEHIALYRTIVYCGMMGNNNGLLIKSHKYRGGRLRV